MSIYLTIKSNALPINRQTLRRRVAKLLAELNYADWDLSLLVTDDAGIKEINREYRQKNKATNVLSFSMLEGEPMPGAPAILGDLVISAETIIKESASLGYTPEEMFYFYLIHGLLHLVGYDHEKGAREAQAQEAENLRLFQQIKFHQTNKS